MPDRITSLSLRNIRCFESLDLDIGPNLTVLLGENGSGKSTIAEALKLLRESRAAPPMPVCPIRRVGTDSCRVSVTIEDSDGLLSKIDCSLPFDSPWNRSVTMAWGPDDPRDVNDRLDAMLGGIVVHETGRAKMAEAWRALRATNHGDDWDKIVGYASLGLPSGSEFVTLARGYVGVQYHGESVPIPLDNLSDGEVAHLSIFAATHAKPQPSLFVVDGPELYQSHGMVARVATMLESYASRVPVLVATHATRFLSATAVPVGDIRVLCEDYGPRRAFHARSLDPVETAGWLEQYDDVGAVIDAGYLSHIIEETPVEAAETRAWQESQAKKETP